MAPPGLTADQRKTLNDAIERLVKSDPWKEVLKQKGWDNAYLSGTAFPVFLKAEQERVQNVMQALGLVK